MVVLHKTFSVSDLADGILHQRTNGGSRLHLAKAISLVESTRPDDAAKAQDLIERLLPHTGNAYRIGITGVPGVGKSTFIEVFGLQLIQGGHRVAVLAVDPSSTRTGGSILGDKTRMQQLSRMDEAFIRPSPTGMALGGVARRTRESMLLCEAAGFDVIIVETVGVGQSETAVASMVDFFLMLLLPNAGDELQGIKRGIMELADGFVINKADTDSAAAERAAQQIRNAVHLAMPKYPDWQPDVLLASALAGTGVDAVWRMCEVFFAELVGNTRIQELRKRQAVRWMEDALNDGLRSLLYERDAIVLRKRKLEQEVYAQKKSPTAAAAEILRLFQASNLDR